VPDVVLKRRYGDCKDKSYLLISLLSEMGIDAHAVLLSASAPKLPARMLASPAWFNHVVVQIKIDGRDYYVDPTSPRQPEPLALIPGALPGAAALLVERGSSALITLPPRSDTLPHHELVQDIAVANFDGAATMETRDIFRGTYADHARLRYPTMSVNEQKKAMLANYEKRYPGVTLVDAPVLQDFPTENRYEIRTRYRLPKAVTLKEKKYSIDYDPHLVDDTLGIPDKIVRNFPLELAAGKFRGRYRLNITWPAAVRGDDIPRTNTIDNPYFRSHEEYTFRGNVVNYLMDYRIKSANVAAAEMPAFQAEAKKLDAFSVGHFSIASAYMAAPEAMRYSARELDSLRNGRSLMVETPLQEKLKDAEIDSELACRFITLTAGIEDIAGPDVLRQAKRLEKVVSANRSQAAARECLALLAFSRGQYAQGAQLYRAEAATLKDDSTSVRNLAWASLYAGEADAAVAAMARYRKGRAASPTGLASNTDIADEIALLQRAGKPLPAETARTAADIPDGPWPRPLLAMQAGLITPEALVKAAEALPGDARDFALTEAWFYIGQAHLARKDLPAARRAFQWIAGGGIRSMELYPQALGELQRLATSDAQFKAGASAYKEKDAAAARVQWEQGAAVDDAKAIYALAHLALGRDGSAIDRPKALALFERAAALGHAPAHFMLGNLYSYSADGKPELERAFKHYLAGAELGDGDAQASLGDCYRNGAGVAKDNTKAAFWYLRASQRGHMGAAHEMARAYQHGWGVTRDPETARNMHTVLADAGYAPAQANLGWMYFDGHGGNMDRAKAASWFRKSAAQGNPEGQYGLGKALVQGDGVRQDYTEGMVLLRKAAAQGVTNAMVQVGYAYDEGAGVDRDYAEAMKWYLRAAQSGNAIGEYNIAMLYKFGKGVSKDPAETRAWLGKAARHGDGDAARMVGQIYRVGEHVGSDMLEAAKWYTLGSEQGDAVSQFELGAMYLSGPLEKDAKKAFSLFERAAAQGNTNAEYQLGVCYENGIGVAADIDKAVEAYRKSVQGGMTAARARQFVMHEDGRLKGPDLSGLTAVLAKAVKVSDSLPLQALADIYLEKGRHAQAQAALEGAVKIEETAAPRDLEANLKVLEKLGRVLRQQQKLAEAESVDQRVRTVKDSMQAIQQAIDLAAKRSGGTS
jgi:TPR repeat protein